MKKPALLAFAAAVVVLASVSVYLSEAQVLRSCDIFGTCPDFVVQPIVLGPVPYETGQYCGNPNDPSTLSNKLAFVGDPNFLNVRWVAEDPSGIKRQIGTDCWLNCPGAADPDSLDLTKNLKFNISVCSNDGAGIYQNCSYRGPTGDHACSMTDVAYKFNGNNTVVCRFFDPLKPAEGLAVPDRTFRVTDFTVNVQPIAVTVGASTTLPISVRSFGLLDAFYRNNLSAANLPWFVQLTNPVSDTAVAACGGTVETLPRVVFLSANTLGFTILVNGSNDKYACAPEGENAACNYLGLPSFGDNMCMHGRCMKKVEINIDASSNSLPEYGMPGFAALLALSSAVFFFARRKQKF